MATLNQTHVHDLSTLANFSDWAQSIGKALASFGWTQTSDTGQVVWAATYAITAVTKSGSNGVYTYTLSSNYPPRTGISVTITGCTNSANNGTFTITAVNYSSGTFTVANSSAVTETGSSGSAVVQSAQSSVPTSGNYVYEIWQPGDSYQTFYVRMDYGNSGGSSPAIKVQIGSSTTGAGVLSGTTLTQYLAPVTANSGSTLYNCLFSGDSGSFTTMFWRDSGDPLFWSIERSRDSSGNPYGTSSTGYVTLITTKNTNNSNSTWGCQSLVFGVGAGLVCGIFNTQGWANRPYGASIAGGSAVSQAFNGNIPASPIFPYIGYFDTPMLTVMSAPEGDLSELATFTITMYGASHTYLFSKVSAYCDNNFTNYWGTAMRWE